MAISRSNLQFSGSDVIFVDTFRRFTLVGAAVAFVLSAGWAVSGMYGLSAVLVVFGAIMLVLRRYMHVLGHGMSAAIGTSLPTVWIIAVVAVSGGPAAPRGVWLLLPPIVAALIFRARFAVRWTWLYAAVVVVLWALQLGGFEYPELMQTERATLAAAISSITAFLATAALTQIYALSQQRAVDTARSAESHLHLMLETLPEGVLAVQRDAASSGHRVLYINPALSDLLGGAKRGVRLEELDGEADRALVEALLKHFREAADSREPLEQRVEHTDVRGTHALELHSQVLRGGDGHLEIVSIIRDLTEKLEAERRLRQNARLASIGELVAGVAHELNNPLAAIKGTAELVAARPEDVTRSDLVRIRDHADRAARIVRSLLGFARAVPPERVPTDLNALVRTVLDLRPRRAGIAVESSLAEPLPLALADPAQLEQVLGNLLSNAEHAVEDRNAGEPRVDVYTRAEADSVVLEVCDNGIGLPPHVMTRLFDPFFTTRRFGQGTGLGLPVVHGIVTAHGGSIEALNRAEGGARFIIRLPVADASSATAAQSVVPVSDAAQAQSRRVLIADDEESIRDVVARYLQRRGHHVETASDGEDVMRLASSEFDCIILDIRMPGMNGDEVFRRWREVAPELADRVIFATGDTVSGATAGFLRSTGRPVLEKPYDLSTLAEVVEGRARPVD